MNICKECKSIVPWIESVTSDGEKLEHCLKGLKPWGKHTEQAIVTTWSKYSDTVYGWLRERTNLVHGGFKTYDLLATTFDNPAEWAGVAEAAGVVAQLTGKNYVLLDNEVTLGEFFAGHAAVDFAKLTESLKPLAATGLSIYWYQPSIQPNTPEIKIREYLSMRLIETLAEAVPNSVFDSTPFAWSNWMDNERDAIGRWQRLCALIGADRVQQRLIVTDTGRYANRDCLVPRQARTLLTLLDNATVYSGRDRWVPTAEAWNNRKGD